MRPKKVEKGKKEAGKGKKKREKEAGKGKRG